MSYAVGAGSQLPVETGMLRNVTVFAQFGYGIVVDAGAYARLVIRALDYSIFHWVNVLDGGLITPPGSPTNIDDQAAFVNVTARDFHPRPDSATIDAGITSAANGVADLDGRARAQGRQHGHWSV